MLNAQYKCETDELKERQSAGGNLKESNERKFLHYIFLHPECAPGWISFSYFSKVTKKRGHIRIRTSHSLACIFQNRTLKPTINPRPGFSSARKLPRTNDAVHSCASIKISRLRRRVIKILKKYDEEKKDTTSTQ